MSGPESREHTIEMEKESAKYSERAEPQSAEFDMHDIYTYHERSAGRLVLDPEEAKIEFGEEVASKLKLNRDGTKVLWPQPTDSPNDPQNWSTRRKTIQLIIITLAAIVPDFDSATGIAALFGLAKQFDTTPNVINNLTSNWSIFLLGWGSIFAVMLMRRYGRLPVLFWSQVFALSFMIGCTFSPNLKTFTAMRCLTAFFGTAPQVTGLYAITDMYPFHLQARKINIWTMGFVSSPFISPFLFGFLVARTSWRWAYGVGSIYGAIVLLLITFFGEETIYDRTIWPIPEASTKGFRHRLETLIGVTGLKMARYRSDWLEIAWSPINVLWRPHVLSILIFEGVLFGFTIGINTTNAVFLGNPPPEGFGFSGYVISGLYATPVVAVFLGELSGRFTNDWIMNTSIRRNRGIFEAESRLWACYIAVPLYVCGFLVLGASFQKHLSIGAIIIGWGITIFAMMINTVVVYAYLNDCFPRHKGEVSALVNFMRTMGGFAVAYFQVPWADKSGAIVTFGVEAAIVAALFLLIVPALQVLGQQLRQNYSLH